MGGWEERRKEGKAVIDGILVPPKRSEEGRLE